MKIGIMQPYFFPYIGYFQLINAVDKFIIYDDVNYIKQGWINRNRILIGGKPSYIVVPVKHATSFKRINEISIDYSSNWIKKVIDSIRFNYSKTPHFSIVFPQLENLLLKKYDAISELSTASIAMVLEYLGLNTLMVQSSGLYKNADLNGPARVLDICKKENATDYFNAINGISLYSYETFKKENIELKFLKSKDSQYTQFKSEFVPWLSIIDVLMFNSIEETRIMLDSFELV